MTVAFYVEFSGGHALPSWRAGFAEVLLGLFALRWPQYGSVREKGGGKVAVVFGS